MSEQLSFELLDAPIVAPVVDAPPPDAAARERITTDLGANLFVEAGAGAGKTTQLVGRVLELVRAGVPITSIAAITFTEKAAADLRHRLRRDLTAAEVAEHRHRLASCARRPRRSRSCSDRHAARVRPSVALRVPDRGRAAARLHRARRARERSGVPRAVGRPARPAARRSRSAGRRDRRRHRVRAAVRVRRVRRPTRRPSCRRGFPRQLGPRRRPSRCSTHHPGSRSTPSRSASRPNCSAHTTHRRTTPNARCSTELADLARLLAPGNSIRTRLDAVVRIAARCHKAQGGRQQDQVEAARRVGRARRAPQRRARPRFARATS